VGLEPIRRSGTDKLCPHEQTHGHSAVGFAVEIGRRNAHLAQPKLHFACQFDGQQTLHGRTDEGQRHVGRLDFVAQKEGFINPSIPPLAVLYTLYARACDPVVEFLKMSGLHTDEEIIHIIMTTCFAGLSARAN